ncbi:pol protein [Cucumis melo var. makuwa]|uniref:Pol protein n=1 Tax=Cucumis melo var. makuwa TaxID=1194695 RepID=A0A5A7UX85_CUCMM|nr:pol protein [Cucumis melo var. makuwa]
MFRACALEFQDSRDSHLHLMEFSYNNSFQATIGMTPFEALYDKCCRSPIYWDEVGEQRLMGLELVQSTNEAKGNSSPRFIGPLKILEQFGIVAYGLALPPSLSAVHDVFHVSMLRKYVTNQSHVVDYEPLEINENLSYAEQPVEILAREVNMLRNRGIPLVKVLWQNHKVEETTRHPLFPSSSSFLLVVIPTYIFSSSFIRCRHEPNPSFAALKPSRTSLPPHSIVRSVGIESHAVAGYVYFDHCSRSTSHRRVLAKQPLTVVVALSSPPSFSVCRLRSPTTVVRLFVGKVAASFVRASISLLPSNFKTHSLILDICFSSGIEFFTHWHRYLKFQPFWLKPNSPVL